MTLAMCERDVRIMRVAPGPDAGTWGRMAESLPGSHLAHAVEWADVIAKAYGHEPLYLAAVDEQGHTGLLPAFGHERCLKINEPPACELSGIARSSRATLRGPAAFPVDR